MLSKNKEYLSKKAREMSQNLSKEEKDKKWQYTRQQYRNLFEEEKGKKRQYGREDPLQNEQQKFVEYINNHSIM